MSNKATPVFTYSFVVACIIVFFGSFTMPTSLFLEVIDSYSVQPASFAGNSGFLTLFSYMFLHLNFQHLVSNMLVLLSVGRAIESEIGSTKFGLVFLGSGIFSGFAHVLFNQDSTMNVIGASGAVFGSIAVLLLLMPFTFTSALLLPLPGVVLGLAMLAIEIYSMQYGNQPMVAHDVHLYGFVGGSLAAFGIDYNRAMKGLIISVIVVIGLYYWVFHLQGLGF